MAVNYDQNYFPISTAETYQLDALSVRHARENAENVCHFKAHVGNLRLPISSFSPTIVSRSSNGTETLILHAAGVYIPDGYNVINLTVGHYRTSGTGTTTWKIYASPIPYRGPEAIDTTLTTESDSDTITTSSGTHAIFQAKDLLVKKNASGICYMFVTASDSDGTTVSNLLTIDAWCLIS